MYVNKIKNYEESIRRTPEWLADVKKKALERNIPLDTMIRKDAEYLVEQEKK